MKVPTFRVIVSLNAVALTDDSYRATNTTCARAGTPSVIDGAKRTQYKDVRLAPPEVGVTSWVHRKNLELAVDDVQLAHIRVLV